MTLAARLLEGAIPRELSFDSGEYGRRLAAVRERMAEGGIEVLLVTNPPNQCYLTGYQSGLQSCYSVLFIPLEGDLTFHLPDEDASSVLFNGDAVTDLVVFDWSYPLDGVEGQLVLALRERGHDAKAIGVEMGRAETYAYGAMDARTFAALSESLPNATLLDATNLVQEVRLRKSPAELACMRQAGEWSALGIEASIGAIVPGRTENEIVAAGYHAMIGAGSEVMTIDPLIFSGKRASWAAPHNMYRRTPVNSGDAIYLEYSANYHRYNAPMMRTVSIGEPSDGVRRLAAASLATVDLLIQDIRAGRTGHEVASAASEALSSLGSDVYFHGGYGYAVGLGFPPTWTEAPVYIADGVNRELEPGMTFHLPICLWVPGEHAVGFSETVCVTKSGCEVLTGGLPREVVVR